MATSRKLARLSVSLKFVPFRIILLIVKGYSKLDVPAFCRVASTKVAKAFCQGAAALTRDFDETTIIGNLLE